MKRICRKTRNRGIALPAITLTPFIDTVLVLLVIFMVTSPGKAPEILASSTLTQRSVPDKPVDNQKYKALVVFINAQGKIFVDGVPVQEIRLAQEITRGIQRSPITTVRIHSESSSPSSIVHKVIDTVRQIQGVKIVFW